ncbi:MAG: NAD-dependent epimerase/dehydratase family protein [Acidobacteria bacterium]|nr:NAD-dependent epimerase/dehydratase family protein [Acidobacteriota bacterium]
MLESLSSLRPKETLPRILADFLVVQLAAAAAVVGVLLVRLHERPQVDGAQLSEAMGEYYLTTFLPLSLIYPAVFLLSGIYTRTRFYAWKYKWWVVVRTTLLATLLYLFANFLLTRAEALPRSGALAFACLAVCGTVGARWLKHTLLDPEAALPAEAPAVAPDRVLVVGGAGYIGSILVRKLLEAGRQVRILDSLVYGDSAIREVLDHPRLELIRGDCRNIQDMVSAVNGVRAIVHLGAIVGDPACEQDRRAALEVNYAATRMMIHIAKGHGVERFVFASSCSVYGASEHLMDENSEVQPISLYAQTKVDSERALMDARSADFHPTILRLATVFGHSYRPRFDLVVNLLTAKAHQEGVITIYNGQQWRPFLHVRDVAGAIVKTLHAPVWVVSGKVYNLGDSRMNYTLAEVAAKIQAAFAGTRVEHVENSDRRNYRVSFERIANELGFHCTVRLEEGIEELRRALQQGQVADYTDVRYHNQRFLQTWGSPVYRDEVDAQVMAAFARALQDPHRARAATGQAAR